MRIRCVVVLAVGLLLPLEAPTARADPDPITSESGEIRGFTLHSTGGGVGAIVEIDLLGPFDVARRNNILEPLPIPTTFSQHIQLIVTSVDVMGPATILGLAQTSGPAFMDVFPFPHGDVSFCYELATGFSLQQTSHSLALEGDLTLLDNTSDDDYSPFMNGGTQSLTLTDVDNDVGSIVLFGGDANGYDDFWQTADQS